VSKKKKSGNNKKALSTWENWLCTIMTTPDKAKKGLFVLLIGLLFLPLIQANLKLINIRPLDGSFVTGSDTALTVADWFNDSYQSKKTSYFNDNFGFRNFLVRLRNQLDYSFFNKANADDIVIGKKNYLFWLRQIKAYYGQDFIGADSIEQRMEMLKYVQDTLAKLHKTIVMVLAPGKAIFYPEYIPDKYRTAIGHTNYEYYRNYADKLGINCIDLTAYLLGQRKSSKDSLFPQYGVHLSVDGNVYAGYVVMTIIGALRHINLTKLIWKYGENVDEEDKDLDAEKSMNLLFDLKKNKTLNVRPIVKDDKKPVVFPTVLIIGDSYARLMFTKSGLALAVSNMSHLWLYGKNFYAYGDIISLKKSYSFGKKYAKRMVLGHDVTVIMATDVNYPDFGFGIIEELYKQFKSKQNVD